FDLSAALAAERKDRFEVGKCARIDSVFVSAAALETEVANLQEIIAIGRDGEQDQRIEPVHIFTADEFFAHRVEQRQSGIERGTTPESIDIEDKVLAFTAFEVVIVDLRWGADGAGDGRRKTDRLRLLYGTVRSGFSDFRKMADINCERLRNAAGRHNAKLARAEFCIGGCAELDDQSLVVFGRSRF